MQHRNWIFYKVMAYIGLAIALSLLVTVSYMILSGFRMYSWETIVQLIMLGALLQSVFYILCIRLIHYFVPNRVKPGLSFNIGFTALLIFNTCIALGMLLVLAFGFSELFLKNYSRPGQGDYIALLVVGGYTFVTIYISAASVVLRRYNHYQVTTDEEDFLKELGDDPIQS